MQPNILVASIEVDQLAGPIFELQSEFFSHHLMG